MSSLQLLTLKGDASTTDNLTVLHPVIPIALIVVAVIAVIGLSIIDKTVSRIIEAVGSLPGPVQSVLAIGIAIAAAGTGISLAASQFKPRKNGE